MAITTLQSKLLTYFLTSLMLCVLILYISGGTYSLKSTPNDKLLEKLFMAILFTLRVFARNLLRGNRRWNTFRISFWCLAWDSNPGFSSNKPTHYLLDRCKLTIVDFGNIWQEVQCLLFFIPKDQIPHRTTTCSILCGGTYSFKSIQNYRFLRNFSQQFYLFSEFCQ